MGDNNVLRRCLNCQEPVSKATIVLKIQGDAGEGNICDARECHTTIGKWCAHWGLVKHAGLILISDAPPNLIDFQVPFRNTQRDYNSLPNKVAAVIRKYKRYEREQQAKSQGRKNGKRSGK